MTDHTPEEVAEKFLDKLKSSPFVMIGLEDSHAHSEPMTAQLDDDRPNTLYFFTGADNRLAKGGKAMAQFAAKGHDFFACLSGIVVRDSDAAQVDRLWNKQADAWFPNGKADATLLRFDIDGAELWETDVSIGGKMKMLFGGTIRPDEAGSHAKLDSVA